MAANTGHHLWICIGETEKLVQAGLQPAALSLMGSCLTCKACSTQRDERLYGQSIEIINMPISLL